MPTFRNLSPAVFSAPIRPNRMISFSWHARQTWCAKRGVCMWDAWVTDTEGEEMQLNRTSTLRVRNSVKKRNSMCGGRCLTCGAPPRNSLCVGNTVIHAGLVPHWHHCSLEQTSNLSNWYWQVPLTPRAKDGFFNTRWIVPVPMSQTPIGTSWG